MSVTPVLRLRRLGLLFSVLLLAVFGSLVASPAYAAIPDGGVVTPDIVGGGVVGDNKPWIAALHSNGSFTCTSSQISESWIITAAHCVPNDSGYSVRIGSLTRSSGGTVVAVDQVIRHEGFNWPTHDIALLHLATPFQNTYVALAEASGDIALNQSLTLYGWGSENPDWSGPLPENLKYADGYLSATGCHSDVAPLLCTQTDGSVAGGDSGGPVFVQSPATGDYVQAGVCALGWQPAGNGQAGYTSFALHREWISQHSGV